MLTSRSILVSILACRAAAIIIFGVSVGPGLDGDVDPDAWTAAFSKPDATGSSTIRGYNMTLPYPGSPSDDWAYTIKVKADVPLPQEDGLFTTGTWLQPEPPKSLLVPKLFPAANLTLQALSQDPSWQVCRQVYVGPGLKSDTAIPGPGCQGFLPADCVADLTKKLEAFFANSSRGVLDGPCPLPRPKDLPQSCNFGRPLVGVGGDINDGFRPADDILRFGNGTDKHRQGNATLYEQAVRQVFVVAHVWGFRGKIDPTSPNATVFAEVTCLQANSTFGKTGAGGGGTSSNGTQGGGDVKNGSHGRRDNISSLESHAFFVLAFVFTALFSSGLWK